MVRLEKLQGHRKIILLFISGWAIAATAFHLYSVSIGFLEPRTQRSIHLLFMLPLIFLIFPTFKKQFSEKAPYVPDIAGLLLFLVATLPFFYSWWHVDRINLRLEVIDEVLPIEVIMGSIAIVLLVEGLRRAVSPILAGLVCLGLAYLFLCEYTYGFFYYRDIEYVEIIETVYLLNGLGIFGSITGIASTMVAIFIAYGAFIEASGVGRLCTNGGELLAGRYAGGPAKVAVITSAFFGSMSGSASANVFTTGSFTIPMMKRIGYRSEVAGGIETAASVGGQSAPPIMGAGAFIMAEITNIPYTDIIIGAVLGAFCYFTLVLVSVHLEAKKKGLQGLDEKDIPKLSEIVKDLYLLIPIAVLIAMLLMRYSPHWSAFCSIISTVIVSSFNKRSRMSFQTLLRVFNNAGRNTATIAIACAGAGVLIAVMTKTGLIISFGSIISDLSGGHLWGAGIVLMFVTLIMGMGVPTTPAYVITSAIGAPLLINEFGVPVLAAHMFVFYFAILADATPPVSIASYAAASIAKSNPLSTGIQASRMAIAGYIVGFSYLYVPELRLEGSAINIIGNLMAILGGMSLVAGAMAGYFGSKLNPLIRLIFAVVGLMIALYIDLDLWIRVTLAIVIMAGWVFFSKLSSSEKNISA